MPVPCPVPGSETVIYSEAKLNPLQVLMACYLNWDAYKADPKFPSKPWLYEHIVRAIWGEHNPYRVFCWHPWANKMNEAAHEHQYLGVVGCGSSGKTDFFALYGLVNWMMDPLNTLVLMTSTSIKDSKKRIWGAMNTYYLAAGGDHFFPGKMVDSLHQIRTILPDGTTSDRSGVAIIASEKKREKEAIGKLIGLKCKRVFLIADELPELSEALMEAALSNLSLNPQFQMVGLGNLWSMYDPLGTFVRPKLGWNSLNHMDTEWETEKGWCIRFDGERSPNVEAGQDIYPFIYKKKDLDEQRSKLGANSVGYWRMCRSFIPPISAENTIYSEADLIHGRAFEPVTWFGPPILLAAMDPGYTMGGDRTAVVIGALGYDTEQKMILSVEEVKTLVEDVTDPAPRSQQMVKQFMDLCLMRHIPPDHAAMDATGGGLILHDVIAEKWSPHVLPVKFGGGASDLPVGLNGEKASDLYDRRVSELWHVGVEYIRAQQIRKITFDLANEMKARHYEHTKAGGLRIKVETKVDMKSRIGFSPDFADAFFVLLELARVRFGFVASPAGSPKVAVRNNFQEVAKRFDQVHSDLYSEPMQVW